MKLLFILLLPFNIYSQANHIKPDSFVFGAKPDSIVFTSEYGYVYITTDTGSKYYDWIMPKLRKNIKHIYIEYIEHIKKTYKQKITKHHIEDSFPRAWNTVYIHKNNYMLYAPSDWMSNSGFYITDSIIYITSSDPGDLYVITNTKYLNRTNRLFKIINMQGVKKEILIEEINHTYGIYSWEIIDEKHKTEEKFLMQNSLFSKKLPMLVFDCGENKCIFEIDGDDFFK